MTGRRQRLGTARQVRGRRSGRPLVPRATGGRRAVLGAAPRAPRRSRPPPPSAGCPSGSRAHGPRPRASGRSEASVSCPATTSVISPRTSPSRPGEQVGQRARGGPPRRVLVSSRQTTARRSAPNASTMRGQGVRRPVRSLEEDHRALLGGQLGQPAARSPRLAGQEPLEAEPVDRQPRDGQRGQHRRGPGHRGHRDAGSRPRPPAGSRGRTPTACRRR